MRSGLFIIYIQQVGEAVKNTKKMCQILEAGYVWCLSDKDCHEYSFGPGSADKACTSSIQICILLTHDGDKYLVCKMITKHSKYNLCKDSLS